MLTRLLVTAIAFAALGAPSVAQLSATRLYVPLNQPVTVEVSPPDDAEPALSVRLIDALSGRTVDSAPTPTGAIDLASLFPSIWADPSERVLLAQLRHADRDIGAPLVLQPLVQRDPVIDALTLQLLSARDAESLERLRSLSDTERAKRQSIPADRPGDGVVCGLRVYQDRLVRLETSAGPITIALLPEHAPNTAFAFRSLVEGGLYDSTIVHRVVASDARGRPFLIQAGDPTGLGLGGPGFHLEFERSALPHDLGVVSLARRPTDLNSGGSQFFICLSREACAGLDGQYTSFAQVIEGLETLDTIAAVPTGPVDSSNPASAHERPLDPPVIVRATTVPAPPFENRAPPISRKTLPSVER